MSKKNFKKPRSESLNSDVSKVSSSSVAVVAASTSLIKRFSNSTIGFNKAKS